jgi:hypothetical protein
MAKTDPKAILTQLRERYKVATEADQLNRRQSMEDMKFINVPGADWDLIVKQERGIDRPMYSFPKLRISCKRVINDMRSNRPQGKVRAFEDGDKDTAEVYEGLCRNIWNNSDGDSAIDMAAEYQVPAGIGAWRICTEYSDDTAFDQDICIDPIPNPYCLYPDPTSQDMLYRDSEYWILTQKVGKSAYERKYPKSDVVDWEGSEFDDEEEWQDENSVRVCEYWYKEPKVIEIALLSDGQSVDLSKVNPADFAQMGLQVVRTRTVNSFQIKSCICSGDAVLEGPTDWAGSNFPFVMIHGEHMIVDGKRRWFGLVRFAKDAQKAYNMARTAIAETIALAPQAKIWATAEQAKGLASQWSDAHKKNLPYMLYNPDPKAPGPPVRIGGADVPIALMQEAQIASDDIKAVTGIFDASLGNKSNEQSGIAIRARQSQGEIATFNYMDNMAKGIRRTWEILIDLIPKIYDTERSVRILGQDGAEKYKRVNSIDPATGQPVLDMSKGKYDVAITVGPSYATQRQEAVESYTAIGQTQPELYSVAGDIIFRNMDLPGAEQIAERLKLMLPPQIQQSLAKDGQKPMPPEVVQAMQQVQQMQQQVEQHGQLVQQASAEVEQKSSEVYKAISDLNVKRAQFDADVAKSMAAITAKEAELVLKEAQSTVGGAQQEVANDRQSLQNDVQNVLAELRQREVDFSQQAMATMAQIQSVAQPQVHVHEQPKPKIIAIHRQNGALVPQYEDTPASGVMQ